MSSSRPLTKQQLEKIQGKRGNVGWVVSNDGRKIARAIYIANGHCILPLHVVTETEVTNETVLVLRKKAGDSAEKVAATGQVHVVFEGSKTGESLSKPYEVSVFCENEAYVDIAYVKIRDEDGPSETKNIMDFKVLDATNLTGQMLYVLGRASDVRRVKVGHNWIESIPIRDIIPEEFIAALGRAKDKGYNIFSVTEEDAAKPTDSSDAAATQTPEEIGEGWSGSPVFDADNASFVGYLFHAYERTIFVLLWNKNIHTTLLGFIHVKREIDRVAEEDVYRETLKPDPYVDLGTPSERPGGSIKNPPTVDPALDMKPWSELSLTQKDAILRLSETDGLIAFMGQKLVDLALMLNEYEFKGPQNETKKILAMFDPNGECKDCGKKLGHEAKYYPAGGTYDSSISVILKLPKALLASDKMAETIKNTVEFREKNLKNKRADLDGDYAGQANNYAYFPSKKIQDLTYKQYLKTTSNACHLSVHYHVDLGVLKRKATANDSLSCNFRHAAIKSPRASTRLDPRATFVDEESRSTINLVWKDHNGQSAFGANFDTLWTVSTIGSGWKNDVSPLKKIAKTLIEIDLTKKLLNYLNDKQNSFSTKYVAAILTDANKKSSPTQNSTTPAAPVTVVAPLPAPAPAPAAESAAKKSGS